MPHRPRDQVYRAQKKTQKNWVFFCSTLYSAVRVLRSIYCVFVFMLGIEKGRIRFRPDRFRPGRFRPGRFRPGRFRPSRAGRASLATVFLLRLCEEKSQWHLKQIIYKARWERCSADHRSENDHGAKTNRAKRFYPHSKESTFFAV